MRRNIVLMMMLAMAVLLGSCGKKSSMDEATEKALIEKYGEPVEVSVSKPGTLSEKLEGLKDGDGVFLRIFGELNGTDIVALNNCYCHSSVKVLDLLDADFVAGGKPYDIINFDGDSISLTEDHVAGQNILSRMTSTEQLFLPLTLTKIDAEAFNGLRSLTYVRLPQSLTIIGDRAFSGSDEMASVELPEGLDSLGAKVFGDGIKTIRIPKSVRRLAKDRLGEFTDIYMEWTPDELRAFQDFNLEWLKHESKGQGVSTFTFMRPTLHVPADYIEAYKSTFKNYGAVVADNGDEPEPAAESASLNNTLMGRWSNNNDPTIEMVLAAEQGDHDGIQGMGYLLAANEYFEYDLKLVFKNLTADGNNIRVSYDKIEQTYADPDDPDSAADAGEKKIGEGELTVVALGSGKAKIESSESRLNGVQMFKAQ